MTDRHPSAPSTRESESGLRDVDDLCPYEDVLGPKRALALVAEIRRYRALLLALEPGFAQASENLDDPWRALQAEVKAIRAERT